MEDSPTKSRQAGARRFPATIPMPEEWNGDLDMLELPDGLYQELVRAAMDMVWTWQDSGQHSPAPLAAQIYVLFSKRKAAAF